MVLASQALAQYSTETVRHHKVAEQDPVAADLFHAENAIEKKDYVTAEPLLQKVVSAAPDNYAAWFDLGFVYHAQGKDDDAIAAYRKSVAAKPDVFESNLNLGLMLAQSHQPDAAQFLRAATTLKPTANVDEGQSRAWLSLAHVLESSNPHEALEAYHRAAALQPADPEPSLSAARLLEKSGDYAGAAKECEQAVKRDGSSQEGLTCAAEMQLKSGNYSAAEQTLQKLADAHPSDLTPRVQLARLYLGQGQNADALIVLNEVLKLDPANQAAQTDLALVYFKLGKFSQAEPIYRTLVGKNPNDADLHARLGQTLLKQLKYADAEHEFMTAVKLRPTFGEAYGDLATAADENKDYELAIRAVNARDQLLPPLPVGYFMRASAFDHLRDYRQATENYHRFLALANGKYPDQEWQARHRLIAIEPKK
ncbi:MAG: tetratricopeptide repeat protein [Terriglobales bacterium]|jgi:Tfp pilus assembly protein PilF